MGQVPRPLRAILVRVGRPAISILGPFQFQQYVHFRAFVAAFVAGSRQWLRFASTPSEVYASKSSLTNSSLAGVTERYQFIILSNCNLIVFSINVKKKLKRGDKMKRQINRRRWEYQLYCRR